MTFDALIDRIIAERIPVRIVSPHLDDAILSCGNLMSYLSDKTDVGVLTVFSEAGDFPYTLSARAFLRQCGFSDADRLFAARRDEDRSVLRGIGVSWKHLGYSDAMFRKRKVGRVRKLLGMFLSECTHAYPTYRFHVTKGRIAPADSVLMNDVLTRIRGLAGELENPVLFFPLGLGRHVDHELLHQLGLQYSGNVIFYSDFPYCLTDRPSEWKLSVQGLRSAAFDRFPVRKHALIRGYATQPLFRGEIPTVPETYHFNDSLMKRL
ncbi:MAG TPA: PIG-L family deacetylase [Candidatus Fimivivens sp.]|nr:PIG-L family deacetylase [Candidatus Fimivivens sp.]